MILVLSLKISKGFYNSSTIISSSRTCVPVVIEDKFEDVVLGDGDDDSDVLLLLDLDLILPYIYRIYLCGPRLIKNLCLTSLFINFFVTIYKSR